MRGKTVWVIGWVILGSMPAWPLVLAQQSSPRGASVAAKSTKETNPGTASPKIQLAKLSLQERQTFLAGQRGMEWLQRANRPDGRFVYGYLPALRSPMEGDHYLQQVVGALALARAARYYRDDKAAALVRQALLTLLLETTMEEAQGTKIRHTALPSTLINRLAAAGLLVSAIHELPDPGKDLQDQANQLGNYIEKQQRADGSLNFLDPDLEGKGSADPGGISHYTGQALYALAGRAAHGQTRKMDLVRKAARYYPPWWREHKNMAMIPWHTSAYAEAYLATKETVFSDAVFEMNDWLCNLQYQQLEPRRPLWRGGFKGWRDGRETVDAPEIVSAAYAESLVQACRVAQQAGDVRRAQRYQDAVEHCLQFLTTLQYTDANTQHFATWYRPALLGAFHASHQNGDLRLDYTSRAVSALVLYLDCLAGQQR